MNDYRLKWLLGIQVQAVLLKTLRFISLLILIALLSFICTNAQNTKITGTVFDSSTGKPLQFANVFISNTTNGSVTREDGSFSIEGIAPGRFILVASFVGYKTKSENVELKPNQNKEVIFKLVSLQTQLDEVQLSAKRERKWNRQLARFEEAFLGSQYDPFVSKTKILNPWVIDFSEGRTSNGLRYLSASITHPLEIENMALGYRLIYHLEMFRQTRNGIIYQGPIQFLEMDTTREEIKKTWIENRQKAYLGSSRHFFKSLIRGDPELQGFKIYEEQSPGVFNISSTTFDHGLNTLTTPFSLTGAVSPGGRIGEFNINAHKQLEVHYTKMAWPNVYYYHIYYPVSWVSFKEGSTEVTGKRVAIDPSDIEISGYMARDRVARMLPHNFIPDDSIHSFTSANEMILSQIRYRQNGLREKPFLFTDKPYYYPGETIWFTAQMLYQNPLMVDTLSRVLYIDLIDSTKQIIDTSMFPIRDGKAEGDIKLSSQLSAGNYVLRAYTNWMRNFSRNDITMQALPVLALFEKVEADQPKTVESPDPHLQIQIETEKSSYQAREKITASILVTDLDGQPMNSSLSIAVTDTQRVATVHLQQTLPDAYNWVLDPTPSSFFNIPKFEIEYGISVAGEFRNKKGQPEFANITIVQGEYEDYGMVETDSLGKFWASGLQFEDSAQIALGVMDSKGRPYGAVTLIEKMPLAVTQALPTIGLTKRATTQPHPIFTLPNEDDYTLLQEIVIEDTPIEAMSERQYGYGTGDKVFSEKDFEKSPQLTVSEFLGRNGTGLNSFKRHNWGVKAAPPLLIIDGSRFGGGAYGGDPWEYLNTLTVDMIKSINVYIYGATIFGMTGSGGVIMIETKRTERQADEKPTIFNKDGFSLYTIEGYAPAREFKAPDYSQPKESHNEPDTRTTIYWNPSLTTDSETGKAGFSFYAADTPTVYRIVVEGMTEDNTPVREVRYIEVRK